MQNSSSMQKVSKGRIKWLKVLFFACLVAWPIAQFAVFYLGVNLNSILMSFKVYSEDGTSVTFGLGNFIRIFTEEDMFVILKSTAKTSFAAYAVGLLHIPIGLFFAYYISKKMPVSGFFRVILFLPQIIPAIVLVSIYVYFLENALPALVNSTDMTSLFFNDKWSFWVVMFYSVIITGFGTSVLMYSNSMANIPPEIIESGRIDGATGLREFRHIILPHVFPTLSVFLVTGIASIFINQINLYSIYGTGAPVDLQTFGYYMYRMSSRTSNGPMQYAQLSAFGLLLSCVAIPLTFIVRGLVNKFGPSED